jgi:hypothetical protein
MVDAGQRRKRLNLPDNAALLMQLQLASLHGILFSCINRHPEFILHGILHGAYEVTRQRVPATCACRKKPAGIKLERFAMPKECSRAQCNKYQ